MGTCASILTKHSHNCPSTPPSLQGHLSVRDLNTYRIFLQPRQLWYDVSIDDDRSVTSSAANKPTQYDLDHLPAHPGSSYHHWPWSLQWLRGGGPSLSHCTIYNGFPEKIPITGRISTDPRSYLHSPSCDSQQIPTDLHSRPRMLHSHHRGRCLLPCTE